MAVRDVRVMLGDQERTLRSDLGAWAAIDDAGGDFLSTLKRFGDPATRRASDILWLLWAFVQGDPKPTRDEVAHWVTLENVTEVAGKIVAALHDGTPVGTGHAGGADPLAPGSSGSGSPDSPPTSG